MRFSNFIIGAWLALAGPAAMAGITCHGSFINPITDICWSCTFPMTIGRANLFSHGQEDNLSNPSSAPCVCSTPPKAGMATGFWEPVRQVDVTRTPYCFVSLGGVSIDVGIYAPRGGVGMQSESSKSSFYHVHWYTNPLFYLLEVVLDDFCIEKIEFDIAYITEVDPTWNDDELTLILNPDVVLFANVVAQAACAADCVAATAGFPLSTLYWCAGCQGSIYPLNGHVQVHGGGVQASTLLVQRMAAKMHREFLVWGAAGTAGLCGYYPQIIMDKSNYKMSMTYPVPQTRNALGRCCQPFGRTTALWGAGRTYPVWGEDFAYLIFRKRNCCAGISPEDMGD
jgi:conjugal transfer pilus assembly protein TraU